MNSLTKGLLILVVLMAAGAGLVLWESQYGDHKTEAPTVTKEEVQLLTKDFNPQQLTALASSADERKKLLKNLREILALGEEAKKYGIQKEPAVKAELKSIEIAIPALLYDRKVNEGKGPMPPFGFIGEDEVKAFWDEDKPAGAISWIWNRVNGRWHESEFDKFIEAKVALARKRGQLSADQEPSEDELKQARDSFAKTRISYYKAKAKLKTIPSMQGDEKKEWEDFKKSADLQVKIQKAQLISSIYVKDVLAKKLAVNDEDIKAYVAEHPELTKTAEKEKTAREVLAKVKEGGDFAELAKEYSEDPGSKSRGGLYEGIAKGQFAKEFEDAVAKLEPGEVTPDIVKTAFGFHIIKLIKRGEVKGADGVPKPTFDARHILISTMVKDPDNPLAREMPVEQYVKAKLEKEKQEKVLKEILDSNEVNLPEDFEVPKISEQQKKLMEEKRQRQIEAMKKQMEQAPKAGPAAPKN